MNYLDFIPIEIVEVFVSYLDYDEFVSFIKYYRSSDNLNYYLIGKYHFDESEKIDSIMNINDYKQYLGLEDLKNKLHLKHTIKKLKLLSVLYLNNTRLNK